MSQKDRNDKKHRARGGSPLPPPVDRLVESLSSRYLLFALGGLFVLDLIVPDPVPLVDEVVLGLATILLARWQSRMKQEGSRGAPQPSGAPKPPPKNVTPRD